MIQRHEAQSLLTALEAVNHPEIAALRETMGEGDLLRMVEEQTVPFYGYMTGGPGWAGDLYFLVWDGDPGNVTQFRKNSQGITVYEVHEDGWTDMSSGGDAD